MNEAPLLSLRDLEGAYDGRLVVAGVDLDIGTGESFVLLGPSGCGKTTLLKLIAGMERPRRGRITLLGRDVTHEDLAARDLNMVFQNYALFPHMTVADNIAFGLRMQGKDAAARTQRMREMVDAMGLGGLEGRLPAELSGGQQQRVALARALAPSPALLLLDEPLGALDAVLRQRMQHELRDLQRNTGTTFVHVTHDQDEALALADRVGIMMDGQLLQVAPAEEVYERPASIEVARFFADSNLLPARPTGNDNRIEIPALGQVCTPPAGTPSPKAGGYVAARPEHLEIVPVERTDVPGTGADAVVEQRLYLGREVRYRVRLTTNHDPHDLPQGDAPGVLTISGFPGASWSPGERVRVRYRKETAHIVPRSTHVRSAGQAGAAT